MASRLPHIIARIKGDLDVDFALVPVTAELIEAVADQHKSAGTLANLAEARFWDGHPVFFQRPDQGFDDTDYTVVRGRPDIHWRHFKRVDRIHHVLYRNERRWMIRWGAECQSIQFETVAVPLSVLAAARNPYLSPRSNPTDALSDGTPLYPAYYPIQRGDRVRRSMRHWDGATGEWAGVTLDGRLYRQRQYWGNDEPRPDEWRPFRLG